MSRRPLLAGNWKLNCLRSEAADLARTIVEGCAGVTDRDVLLAPTFVALDVVREAIGQSNVALGAQDVYWESNGAFTGEVSAPMLADAGCGYVIVGHSERRQFFGETDYTVAKKVAAVDAAGLAPVMCVGETLEERETGETRKVVERQVRHGLVELPSEGMAHLVIAYEPIWAIGTGKVATPSEAQDVHAHIRGILHDVLDGGDHDAVRILYGGSVKPDNVDELMACPDIDGALVGGASLKAQDFLRIVNYEESSS